MKTEILICIICIIGMIVTGCVQREYQFDSSDPNGAEYTRYYKSNYFMTDASADSVEVVMTDGTIIRVNAPVQDSPKIKAIHPAVGVIEVE